MYFSFTRKMRIPKFLCILIAGFLLTGSLPGQTLHKGTVIECNEIGVTLLPGKTLEDYLDVLVNVLGPAIEEAFTGTEVFFVEGNRGNAESKVGAIWVFPSAEVRDLYFAQDGSRTQAWQKASEKLDPIREQLAEIGVGARNSMTWEVINEPRSATAADYYDYLIEYCSKENLSEVPVAPAAMGISDPLLEKLVRDISETTGTLIESGYGKEDPRYKEVASRIRSAKQTLREAATLLSIEEKRAFQKGGSFGYHKLTVTLEEGVTMQQYLDFYSKKYIPELVKYMEGIEVLIMVPFGKPLKDQFVYVNYFRSESSRDQYWPEPDVASDRYDEARNKIKSLLFEQLELGTQVDDYGVWIIQ